MYFTYNLKIALCRNVNVIKMLKSTNNCMVRIYKHTFVFITLFRSDFTIYGYYVQVWSILRLFLMAIKDYTSLFIMNLIFGIIQLYSSSILLIQSFCQSIIQKQMHNANFVTRYQDILESYCHTFLTVYLVLWLLK